MAPLPFFVTEPQALPANLILLNIT
jgi:hypothetical protein